MQSSNTSYRGIDCFRLIAAFLVIAIHTAPLSAFHATGDFILTRIIARVAVPFFLMTSGFFLISRYRYNENKLFAFLKKAALIYGISILIYIPLNLYNGYFQMEQLLPNILRDLFFDGTAYHLWYLPASMIGSVIAWFCVKKAGFQNALFFTLALYIVGLLGDSYYGLTAKLPLLSGVYDGLFELFDYTRNGLFFAPVFFVLGGMIADRSICLSLKSSLTGFAVSLSLLLCEGMLLHSFKLQRHDSMYLLLPLCMYFLFCALTHWKGKRSSLLRNSALIIYLIHPMVIVAVRMIAKLTHTQPVLVENSLVHFLAVSILSAGFSVLLAKFLEKFKARRTSRSATDRAWLELDLNNLKHNITALQSAMPDKCELMAVVKAEAYGHGAYEVSRCVNQMGVRAFAVATIDEGIALRRYGITGEILILGFTDPARARELKRYDLTQTLLDYTYALLLNKQGYLVKAHIKIDTGMHRLGFDWTDSAAVLKAFALKKVQISGIYTHLSASDSLAPEDITFTHLQIQRFYQLIDCLKEHDVSIPKVHIQSSYGLLNYPELTCNYVRAGIALYGVLSSPNDKTRLQLDLRPVLSLKARIALIRSIHSGESVGYGHGFVAKRDSRIAVLPIGYADGLPRKLSCGRGAVLIKGTLLPIIGQICMDQLLVDVTDMDTVSVGDIATLIGKDGASELSAPDVADYAESIANELLSRMGNRLKLGSS